MLAKAATPLPAARLRRTTSSTPTSRRSTTTTRRSGLDAFDFDRPRRGVTSAPRPRLRNSPMAVCVQPGRALALLALVAISSQAVAQQKPAQGAQQAKPAQPAQSAPPVQGFPWAHPVLPQLAPPAAPPAAAPDQGPTQVSPAVLRPAAQNLIDCKQAPKTAVTEVPEPLSKWATIYCTLQGHILTTNERYYSAIPGTQGRLRGVLGAAALNNQNGNIGHGAYFTKIEYAPLDQ